MDGTENPKGLSSEGQASEGEAQGTSTEQTRTLTEQEHNEAVQKAVSDALAKAGRDAKKLSDKEAALKADREALDAENAKIADWERRRDEAELAEARRDPDKLALWQKKQTEKTRDAEFAKREADLKKREADEAKRETEHAEKIKAAEEVTLGMKLYEIAARHDLNPETLKKDMKDLNLTTEQQAEALAKRLSPTGERLPGGEGAKKTTTPVSVPTTGGQREPTQEQREKMSMADYAALRRKENPQQL